MTSTLTPALSELCEIVRAEPDGAVAKFARGSPKSWCAAREIVRPALLDRLDAEGWVTTLGEPHERRWVHLSLSLRVFNGLISVLPTRQRISADYVHVNSDSFWLIELVRKHGPDRRKRAADLGVGNGIVAAHLAAEYQSVIGTDLPGPWMRHARLTLAANSPRGRPVPIVGCDVADALRPGVFDLVASNAPWSPSPPLDEDGRAMTFMDGGPTGTELPSRFLRDASDLLAPGGVAIVLCFDPTFDDGTRPLGAVLDEIEARGFSLEVIHSPVLPSDLVTERLRQRLPSLRHGSHVAVVVRRS